MALQKLTAEPGAFSPERVLRPREQVEQQIKRAIFAGQFAQGAKLPSEAELSERFSVSRATVREALRSLAALGLISKVPGATGGSFVRSVNHEALGETMRESMDNILRLGTIEIHEVSALRVLLEVPSAQLAARHRGPEHIEQMRSILYSQRDATWKDPQIPGYDVAFHRTVAEASGNRVLLAFVTALHLASQPVRFLELSPEVGKLTVRQHLAVFKAIEDQDPEAAGAAMQEHLDYLEDHYSVTALDSERDLAEISPA
jgi:GntR family transcriptional regulator, transcriptional repressor for pyruvate dehydrogenase complex